MDGIGAEIDVVRAQEEYQSKLDEHLRSQQQPKKKEAAPKRKESEFASLRKELTTAKTIAQYIEANHQSTLRETKGLNTFFQVISNRPDKVYTKLFRKYKPHVTLILERLVGFVQGSQGSGKLAKGQSSSGKATLTPSAHEFLIRCEREGVHRKAWFASMKGEEDVDDDSAESDGEGIANPAADDDEDEEEGRATEGKRITIDGATPGSTTAPVTQRISDVLSSNLTPKAMIKMLSVIDVMGRLTRMIEIANNADTCRDSAARIVGAEELSGSEKVQLHTRLISKIRRLIAPFGKATPNKNENSDEDESSAPAAAAAKTGKALPVAIIATREEADEIVKIALDISYELFIRQKMAPTTKYTKFVEWCKADGCGLIPEDHAEMVAEVDTQNDEAMVLQASAIEVLLALKGAEDGKAADSGRVGWGAEDETPVVPGEEKPEQKKGTVRAWDLAQIINTVSGTARDDAGVGMEFFTVTGMDVLSAIAVSAGKKLVADDLRTLTDKDEGCKSLRKRIVNMFINTVKRSNGSLTLPRRAVNFIADERKKEQVSEVAVIRKKRAREDAERTKLMSSRQIQEQLEEEGNLMDME